jgi:hypothetical protein
MSKELKGVYNLNPTSAVMKLGSEQQREANAKGPKRIDGPRMPEGHEVAADEGVETEVHSHAHPAMKTRHSHPANKKHSDGRKHEDHHHAVRQLKGMK